MTTTARAGLFSRDVSERRLPIRLCVVVGPTQETAHPFVRCPRTQEAIDAHACAGCMRMRSLEWAPTTGGEVRCLMGQDPEVDPRADFGEMAARTELFEAVALVATCVTPDLPLERVQEIFARGRARALPVVDGESKLLGLLSHSDLVNASSSGGTVRDVMTSCVHALPYEAPLPYAISLLAHEDICEVPVVKMDGTVVGMCHALDILRWVAAQLGYVTPKR